MTTQSDVSLEKMVFRKTNQHIGRHISVTPQNSTNCHLSYARIILDSSTPAVRFDNENQETGLVCLSGSATVRVASESLDVAQYDSIYIPRNSAIEVSTISAVDF